MRPLSLDQMNSLHAEGIAVRSSASSIGMNDRLGRPRQQIWRTFVSAAVCLQLPMARDANRARAPTVAARYPTFAGAAPIFRAGREGRGRRATTRRAWRAATR